MDEQLKALLLAGANRKLYLRFPEAEDSSFITVETDEDPINVGISELIISGSQSITRILCSENYMHFGECNPARLEIIVAGIKDVTGMRVELYEEVDDYNDPVFLFTGIIESAQLQPNRNRRKIIAYDDMKTLQETDASAWISEVFPIGQNQNYRGEWDSTQKYMYPDVVSYNGDYYMYLCTANDVMVEVIYNPADFSDEEVVEYIYNLMVGINPEDALEGDFYPYVTKLKDYDNTSKDFTYITMAEFRQVLFQEIGIQQEPAELPNDDIQVTYEARTATFGSLIQDICQANGCFGQMTPEGTFKYIFPGQVTEDYTGNIRSETTYSEVLTPAINRVVVYDSEYSEIESSGSGGNVWDVYNSLLCNSQASGAAENLLSVVSEIPDYTAASIQAIVSMPIELGTAITFTTEEDEETVTMIVMEEQLSGVQLIRQALTARGAEQASDLSQGQRLNSVEKTTKDYSMYKDAVFKMLDAMSATFQTLMSQKAEIEKLLADRIEATEAKLQQISVEDIKTGVISSNDYRTVALPLVYPASSLYPADSTFPSDGTEVTSGFAIDFERGIIKGAFYSAEIEDLKRRVTALEQAS